MLATYEVNNAANASSGTLNLSEHHFYGSSRLGIVRRSQNMDEDKLTAVDETNLGDTYLLNFTRGNKLFELTNHLGNVLTVLSDKKIGRKASDPSMISIYDFDMVTASDYTPFGMVMQGRNFSFLSRYRYGFNGKEYDNEFKGAGNLLDYGNRLYDPLAGRFLSVDPLTPKYPELTPYQFASNRPIDGVDLDGLEFMKYNDSYISMAVNYNSKLKKLDAVNSYRLHEKQVGTIFAKSILPGELEARIKNTPSNCNNCIPAYDARVSTIMFEGPEAPDMTDVLNVEDGTPSSLKTQEFRMLKVPRTKREEREIRKSRRFYTPGISASVAKLNSKIAIVEAIGIAGESIGNSYLKYIVDQAKGNQSGKAQDVLIIMQKGIENGNIGKGYLNNATLSSIANYLLYGAPIADKEVSGVAKKLWEEYQLNNTREEQKQYLENSKKQKIDNTGRNNNAGF